MSPQPLMPLLNGSLSRVVVSSQDPRWTWTSHHPFDAPRRCAVERGRAYVSEAEVVLLSEAEIRAILQRAEPKKRPALVGSTMPGPTGGVPGRESYEPLSLSNQDRNLVRRRRRGPNKPADAQRSRADCSARMQLERTRQAASPAQISRRDLAGCSGVHVLGARP